MPGSSATLEPAHALRSDPHKPQYRIATRTSPGPRVDQLNVVADLERLARSRTTAALITLLMGSTVRRSRYGVRFLAAA
jgi:hypothetical protein